MRTAILRAIASARPRVSATVSQPARNLSIGSPARPITATLPSFRPAFLLQARYASGSALNKDQIQERVVEVLKTFEKVNPEKVTATSSFTNDLGLDSLDAVEVVMAIEEEFAVEISDEDADKITTVGEAIDYIAKTPEAH